MSRDWILGLFGGLSFLGVGVGALAMLGFLPPTTFANLLSLARSALDSVGTALRWLAFTANGRQLLFAASTVLAFWLSGQHGWERRGAWDAQQRAHATSRAVKAAHVFLANLTAKDTRIKLGLANNERRTDAIFATIIKGVHVHVTAEIDRRYPVPCGAVRVWDAGYYRVDPSTLASSKCPSDGAPAPITASTLSAAGVNLWKDYWKLKADDDTVRRMYVALADEYDGLRKTLASIKAGGHS